MLLRVKFKKIDRSQILTVILYFIYLFNISSKGYPTTREYWLKCIAHYSVTNPTQSSTIENWKSRKLAGIRTRNHRVVHVTVSRYYCPMAPIYVGEACMQCWAMCACLYLSCSTEDLCLGWVLPEPNQAIGMLNAGLSGRQVAAQFNCHRHTFTCLKCTLPPTALWRCCEQTANWASTRNDPTPGWVDSATSS